jgi:aspartyl-tRNA(Asn)/glutamyl-tRNA(Gln) amidotransferase subunit C
MDKLNELNTDGVEPLIYMNDAVNVLRPDEVIQEMTRAEALQNSPLKNEEYIKVSKVIQK